jgi:hypothetical protein
VFDPEIAAMSDPGEAALIARADLVLAGGDAARDHLVAAGATRVRVAPIGVDVDAFDWEPPPAGRARLLYAGPLAPGRGVRVLIRALLEVPDAEVVLTGPVTAGFAAELRTAIAELGLGGRVSLLPETAHDKLPALIASATICVATEAADPALAPTAPCPSKIFEFLACRRAVVAPRRGSVTAAFTDGEHLLGFEPGSPTELAAQLRRLLDDAALRDRLALAGYERVRLTHTASATRRALHAAYAELAELPAFRARFGELVDEVPTEASSAGTAGSADSSGFVERGRPARGLSAYDDHPAEEDDGGPVDTGLHEGVEVTRVEGPPLGGFDERAAGDATGGTASIGPGDDWVVEDDRIRDPEHRREGDAFESRFVSGELEAAIPGQPRPEVELPFVAVAPPLGFDDREERETDATTRHVRQPRPSRPGDDE